MPDAMPAADDRARWPVLGCTLSALAYALPAVAVLIAVVLSFPAVDLGIDRRFHGPQGWTLEGGWFVFCFYRYASWLALLAAIVAGGVLVGGFASTRLRPGRRQALAVLLALVLGPGLIVNVGLKEHWGRPRPRDTVEFGGTQDYRPAMRPGPSHATSFVSGHASIAFFTCIFFYVWRRSRPRLALAALIASLAYGTAMGIARIGVGAHFPSDVAWAAAISAVLALILDLTVLGRGLSGSTSAGTRSLPSGRPASAAP